MLLLFDYYSLTRFVNKSLKKNNNIFKFKSFIKLYYHFVFGISFVRDIEL